MGLSQSIIVEDIYLNFPVKNGVHNCIICITSKDKNVIEFEIELAEGEPDFWVFKDISNFRGQRLNISIKEYNGTTKILDIIKQSNEILGADNLYKEKYRPQFHFTSKRGWLNDPNGLLYYKGEYHLFYQHNPYGTNWGNMHWGHSVSYDLLHWEELRDVLCPDDMGTMFSGSGVVDANNTTRFQTSHEKPLILIYTAAGGTSRWSKGKYYTQCLAYSNDRGRTWIKYECNPVIDHIIAENRDPKVIWHESTQKWIMVMYMEKNNYALFISKDLKKWERSCDINIPGDAECPDFFELPVDANLNDKKWVIMGAKGYYLLGTFDGKTFNTESKVLKSHNGNHSYAAQTWSNISKEDDRRIQISWATFDIPCMGFNKFMTLPTELTLRNTNEGIRLFTNPVKEIEKLHEQKHVWKNKMLSEGEKLDTLEGELFDINAEIEICSAQKIIFDIRGVYVTYELKTQKLTCLDKSTIMKLENGKIHFRILLDRTSIEIFGNKGRVYMPMGVIPEDENKSVTLGVKGGKVKLISLEIYNMKSIW